MKPRMTRELAHAAAMDAANRNMQKAGRTAWNDEDQAVAVDTYERLWPAEKEIEQARRAAQQAHSDRVEPMLDASWLHTGGLF